MKRFVYISGPMSGIPDHNVPAFLAAEGQLRMAGFGVITPRRVTDYWGPGQAWRWYMREALRQIADADALAMLPGWEKSEGAALEWRIAEGLGLPAIPLGQLLEMGPAKLAEVAPSVSDEARAAVALRDLPRPSPFGDPANRAACAAGALAAAGSTGAQGAGVLPEGLNIAPGLGDC